MTEIEKMRGLMIELIENIDSSTGALKFPKRAVEIIREIADYAKQTKLYRENIGKAESFWQDEDSPEKIWIYILEKVVNAPTTLHRDGSVILHMPALDAALEKTKRCRICGCTWNNACIGGCSWVEEDLCSKCNGE